MGDLGAAGAGQVGNGARHFQGAVRAARRPAQAGGRDVQKFGRRVVQQQITVQRLPLQGLVGNPLARHRPLACRSAARANVGAGLARGRLHQFAAVHCRHFHMQIDAIHQRATELALVARHLVGCAAAALLGGAQIAARAGVHGGNQLELGRKVCPPRRP